jgi:hypothetical protein
MTFWDGSNDVWPPERNYRQPKFHGPLTDKEIESAQYTLAVATTVSRKGHVKPEILVLNVELKDGRTIPIEPISTQMGYHHGYEIVNKSRFVIVKFSPVKSLPSTHELVGYTGPYGGGQ